MLRTTLGVVAVAGVLAVAGQSPGVAATSHAGTRDLTFGAHGVAVLPNSVHHVPVDSGRTPVGLTLAARAGRLWVGGVEGDQDYALRFTAAGKVDPTFRAGRVYWTADSGFISAGIVLPTSDGGAYVVSSVGDNGGDPDTFHIVTRLTRSGSLDTAWGSHGRAVVTVGKCVTPNDYCSPRILAATILPSGRLRFAGSFDDLSKDPLPGGPRSPVVFGLTATGKTDTTVGPKGWTRVSGADQTNAHGIRAAGFDATGRAYFLYAPPRAAHCAAACNGHPSIVRSSANGVLDTGYGKGSSAGFPLPANTAVSDVNHQTAAMSVSPSGEVFVGLEVRQYGTGRLMASVSHLRADGRVSALFGAGGAATYAPVAGSGTISALLPDGNGHVLLGLSYTSHRRISHLILNVSANTGKATRTSFGVNGAVASPVYVVSMVKQSAHRLVVLGWPGSGISHEYLRTPSRLIRYLI